MCRGIRVPRSEGQGGGSQFPKNKEKVQSLAWVAKGRVWSPAWQVDAELLDYGFPCLEAGLIPGNQDATVCKVDVSSPRYSD